MKKTLAGIVLVGAVFVLSGCGLKAPAVESGAKSENPTGGSVVSSIKDAVGLGTKMKCTYREVIGQEKSATDSIVYIEGKKYKATSSAYIEGKARVQNVIFDGETSFIWTDGEKTGIKMTMKCIEEFNASLPQDAQNKIKNDIANSPEAQFKDAADSSCVPFSGADFSIPADVAFTDQCEMMKKTQKYMQDIKVPAGVDASKIPDVSKYLPK
jgi:hypothetical protein